MNYRIQSLLDQSGVLRSQMEIWVMLYPPEILTSTLYAPRNATKYDLRELIREQVFVNLPYSVNYDWENYLIRITDNGDGTDMVTVSILGKSVIPRVRSLLHKGFSKVTFLGDGLQFLAVNEKHFPHTRGRSYQVILPYDELFYLAGFRSGFHISSCALTHANSISFGPYRLEHQQAYLDCHQNGSPIEWPRIQPLVSLSDWRDEFLTPAAFPAWFIARQALKADSPISFVNQGRQPDEESSSHRFPAGTHFGYLD